MSFLFGRSDGGSIVLLSLWQPGRAALDPAKELVFAVSVAKATDTAKRGPSGISTMDLRVAGGLTTTRIV